jgi:tRNA threonylcarbamoyladenosine modification (KEOPS) complex Cgi121 subunit
LATVRSQLKDAITEIGSVRGEELTVVVEQRAKAVAYVGAKRDDLQQEIESMHKHQEAQKGHIELNVRGHRFETSVQTLRRVPGSYFDA